ncbi:MAG: HAMP domain-containing histidine kinase [Streptococcaceae bacterium]|nr:HAMP domain-containing histidine kinase [Streptococcaceae bacterium]
MKKKQQNKPFKFLNVIIFSSVYLLATVGLIALLTQHMTNLDTKSLLLRAYSISDRLKQNPETEFDEYIHILPANADTQAVNTIKQGAKFSRSFDKTKLTITVTVPNYQKGVIQNYVQVTRERSSTTFQIVVVTIFALTIYSIWVVQLYTNTKRLHRFERDTIAKIKNIRRSPLTQSYLISENDDPITTALNHLGETLQEQATSSKPAKKNLYEFIELFEFPIFIYDLKGTIRRSNASFKNEFSDTKNLDIFSPYSDVLQFLVNKMLQPTQQERTFYFEHLNAYYTIGVRPLQSLDHRLMVTMIDVTAYKATTRAHNDFIANVSHDLKTPLAAIAGFADVLATDQDKLTPQDSQKFAKHIVKETKRLASLVEDTLEMTRQPIHLKKTELDLTILVEDVLANFSLAIQKKSLTITTQLTEHLLVQSNEKHLYAIFKNLIENAIHYTPAGGKIFICVMTIQGRASFSISDNGPGLTALEETRIFERFYRADQARDSEGTGLGLAIVKKNLVELGGKIDVVSILGKGTTFTVTL